MISTLEIAWLAGLIEGEGYFSLASPKRAPRSRSFRLGIAMTDRDVIARVAALWGSEVRPKNIGHPYRKPQWVTTICGPRAIGWSLTLYTLLGTRRRQKIRESLAVIPVPWKHRRACRHGHAWPENMRLESRISRQGKPIQVRRCRRCAHAAVKRWEARRAGSISLV